MEGQSRHIVVNGQYIAHLEVDTQIVGVGYVYNINQPPSLSDDLSSVTSESNSDTSFFTTRFSHDIVEKNIREAITLASTKADACRRIMALETQGYIILSNVSDDRKAELINPYAQPKFTLTGEDFKKARNRR